MQPQTTETNPAKEKQADLNEDWYSKEASLVAKVIVTYLMNAVVKLIQVPVQNSSLNIVCLKNE